MDVRDFFKKTNQPGPYFAENTEPMLALEAMVDAVELRNVLYALEHICRAKAQHLEENWQDRLTARVWSTAANRIERLASGTDHRI